MKRIISLIVVIAILCSNLSLTTVYANEVDDNPVEESLQIELEMYFEKDSYNCTEDTSVDVVLYYTYGERWENLTFTGDGAYLTDSFVVLEPGTEENPMENTWIITGNASLTGSEDGVLTANFLIDGEAHAVSVDIVNKLVVEITDPELSFSQDKYTCSEGSTIKITTNYVYSFQWDSIIWKCSDETALSMGETTIVAPGDGGTEEENLWWISIPVTGKKAGEYTITVTAIVEGVEYVASTFVEIIEENVISFAEESYTCILEGTIGLTAIYNGMNQWDDISWECSQKNAVVLSGNSIVFPGIGGTEVENQWWNSVQLTALKIGNYTVTVTVDVNGEKFSASTTLIVMEKPALRLSCNTAYLHVGNETPLKLQYTYASKWDEITWRCSSSNGMTFSETSVVSPTEGSNTWYATTNVEALRVGDYTVTAIVSVDGYIFEVSTEFYVIEFIGEGVIDFSDEWINERGVVVISDRSYELTDDYKFSPSISSAKGKQKVFYAYQPDYQVGKIVLPEDIVEADFDMKINPISFTYRDGRWNQENAEADISLRWKRKEDSLFTEGAMQYNDLEIALSAIKMSVGSEALNFGTTEGISNKEMLHTTETDIVLQYGEKKIISKEIYVTEGYVPKSVTENVEVRMSIIPEWTDEEVVGNSQYVIMGNLDVQKQQVNSNRNSFEENEGITTKKNELAEKENTITLALDYNFQQWFDAETYQDIRQFLIYYVAEVLTVDKYADTVLAEQAEAVKNEIEYRINKVLGVAEAKNKISSETLNLKFEAKKAEVSVVANSKTGEKVTIDFDIDLSIYGQKESNSSASFGQISYIIDGTKPEGINSSSGKAMLSYVDFDAFSDILLEYTKVAYSHMWGKSVDKIAEVMVPDLFGKILGGKFANRVYDISTNFFERALKKITIECPVDVYVYDNQGNLCGNIIDNKINQTYAEIFMEIDGDTKILYLMGSDYELELVGNDIGTMDYSIEEYNGDEVTREVNIYDIVLADGKCYQASIPLMPDVSPLALTLEGDMGEHIYVEKDTLGKVVIEEVKDATIVDTGSCGENVTWTYYSDGLLEISGTGSMYDYKSGINITTPSFSLCDINQVVIREGITRIGENTFRYCLSGIQMIELPNSLEKIGDYAFYGASALKYVSIGKNVNEIGKWAFSFCNRLTYIQVDPVNNYFQSIDGALYSKDMSKLLICPKISGTTFEIPKSVVEIGVDAFGNNTIIKSMTIPETVRTIQYDAFDGCTQLNEITFLGNAPEIGENAFGGVVANVYYPGGNDTWTVSLMEKDYGGTIEWFADDGSEASDIYDMGNYGENIEWRLYVNGDLVITGSGDMPKDYKTDTIPWRYYGELISRIVIESGVTSISRNAFSDCSEVISITIPETIKQIEEYAFNYCVKLEEINFNAIKIEELPSRNDIFLDAGIEGEGITVNVGAQVKRIPEDLFYADVYYTYEGNGPKIKEVIFEEGSVCEEIDYSAFRNCKDLVNINIPESVKYIRSYAFDNCTNLEKITFWKNILSLGNSAFDGCSSLKSAGPLGSGCSIEYEWETEIPSSIFEGMLIESVIISDTIDWIGHGSFEDCKKLSSVIIGKNVNFIGNNAFEGCENLTEIKIYNSECEISDLKDTIPEQTVIYGHTNSTAQKYAETYGRKFVSLDMITIKSISLDKQEVSMNCADTITLSVLFTPEDASEDRTISWKSSDESVAMVEDGVIKAIKEGNCTISATTVSGIATACKVEVTHDYVDKIVEKASFDADGIIEYTCVGCDIVNEEAITRVDSIQLSNEKYVQDGSAKKPTVTVKDKEGKVLVNGTDYTVTYASGRKNVGRYAVTVTLKGNYSGTKKLYFTIVPKKTSSLSATRYQYGNQIRLSWKKVTGATGYRVEYKKPGATKYTFLKNTTNLYYTKGSLTANKTYYFKVTPYVTISGTKYYSTSSSAYRTTSIATVKKGSKLAQVSKPTVTKSGTKVKVSWKNVSSETGYQISRSTSSTGTNIVSTYKTTTGKSKLVSATKGKKYYYKVRAYRTVNGKKIYGAWSPVRSYTR